MKLCFVILAHHQPAVFQRLVRALDASDSDIVVHIDRRAELSKFFSPGRSKIHYLPRRNRVNWSGWSLTRTIIESLVHALRVSRAEYFLLLAGTDFPIRPLPALNDFLRDRYPSNFLSYYPLVPGTWGYQLIGKYHFNDFTAALIDIKLRNSGHAPIADRLLGWILDKTEGGLHAFLPARNTDFIRFYSGSARWCLNRETTQYLTEYYRSHESRRLRSFLRFSGNSDEIFVQTAVLNSKHRDQCLGFCESEAREIFEARRPPLPDERKLNLHYVDWSTEREDPAILVESDFASLKESGKFFAYKFTDALSMGLMDRIERQLLGGS